MSFNSNMSIPSHNKNYNGNIFTANSYMNPATVNSGIPMTGGSAHSGLQYFHAYPQPQQPQQPTTLHPQQATQEYYTTSSSSNNNLSSGSASSTAPTSISDMPLPLPGQQQQQQQMFNPTTAKTIMPQMISGTGASSNPPMPLDPSVTTKFTNNDIQILRQLLIAGEKYKWKQITKEINSSTNHTQHVIAAINKNQQHLQQFQHLQQNSISPHQYQQQQQQQQQNQQNQQMHQQQPLSYGYQHQQPHMLNNNSNNNMMRKSTSMNSSYMSNSTSSNLLPPHRNLNMPHHATPASISPQQQQQQQPHPPSTVSGGGGGGGGGSSSARSASATATTNPMPLKNVSPTFVMKQYQQLLGLPSNSVYFGTLGSSLPYVVAANGWSDIDQEAYNYPFNLDDEE